MFTATVRGMLAHKLRAILTTVSIALGVAFLSGTLMLTDTMNTAITQLLGGVASGNDAVVRQEAAYSAASGVGVARGPVPATVLDAVRQVPGVAVAEGVTSGYALLTDTHGKAVLTAGGAPTVGYTMPRDEKLRGEVRLRSGRAPAGAHEVAIDATSAAKGHIPLGSTIKILFRGPTQAFTVVGTVGFGKAKDLGGTSSAYFDATTAQRVLGKPGTFDEVQVRSDGTLSDAALAKRIDAALPGGIQAVTGATVAKESSDAIKHVFAFVGILFTVFAGIALFVGSFIIWNTFTMIVTQRSREIALMRAIGATRRQVMRNLLLEAGVLGVIASALGVVAGTGIAKGLNALMDALGFSLPSTSLQVSAGAIWKPILVGTVVTALAALVPARRATKVLPVEALREATPGAKAPSKARAVIGTVLTLGGVIGILTGLYADGGSTQVLLGMVGTLFGVITLAPLAARPLAAAIGRPAQLRGVSGELARQNAMRNPRRTASTAAALMIGLTLVVGIGVFAASLKASFGSILDDATKADLYVSSASSQGGGFSPDVAAVVSHVPGVATASATSWGEARFNGQGASYSSIDPATVDTVLDLDISSGSAASLGTDGVLVATDVAKQNGWKVGSVVPAEFAATGKKALVVRGTFSGTGYLDGKYLISLATHEANEPDRLDTSVLVRVAPGADKGTVKAAIASALTDHQDAKVLTRKEYTQEVAGLVDQLLTFVSVMLLLSVLIALLGIVNTLALSVYERTRELGLLRAIGMTDRQVRAMVRWESVIISLIGAGVGAALGVGLGAALAQSLKGDGITQVSVPSGRIALYVLAAAVAGVLAAVWPARSAARVDVLRAVVAD